MVRRRFSKAEKLALFVVQDVDHRGMHADHVVPFSKGVSVRLDNVASIARTLRRQLSDEALVDLIAELGQPGGNE